MDPKQTLNRLQIKPSENFRQTHDKAVKKLKANPKATCKETSEPNRLPPPPKKIKIKTA